MKSTKLSIVSGQMSWSREGSDATSFSIRKAQPKRLTVTVQNDDESNKIRKLNARLRGDLWDKHPSSK